MTSENIFTVFRTITIGLLDKDRKRIGTMQEEEFYHVPGEDPQKACYDLYESLADDSDSLDGLEPDDEDYEHLLQMAIDDLQGLFVVYQGKLEIRPETPPLFEEGEPSRPLYWKQVSPAEKEN